MSETTSAEQTIVVPLDESLTAERALDVAAEIVRKSGGRLVLLTVPHVYGADYAWYAGYGDGALDAAAVIPMEEMVRDSHQAASDYLEGLCERFRGGGFELRTVIAEALPADAIAQTAEEEGATMIVMSTHGRGGIRRWALGSVADKVVRGSTLPVLLVREEASQVTPSCRHILVALDGSEGAEGVLPEVQRLALAMGAKVTLAHVEPKLDAAPAADASALVDAERPFQDRVRDYLESKAQGMRDAGVEVAVETLVDEHVAEALLARAAREDVDLVALTTHGHSGWRRWSMGSVADKIVRACETPVLVERVPGED